METALVTGMFERSLLPEKQVGLDVKESKAEKFDKIFESSLKNNDVSNVEKRDKKVVEDVNPDQAANVESDNKDECLVEEETEDVSENEGKTKEKNKKTKDGNLENHLILQNDLTKLIKKDKVIEEDVELKIEDVNLEIKDNIEISGITKKQDIVKMETTPEEKLDNLLGKLDVEINKDINIKDESEQVIEVGPQSVETEKIKLNIKDIRSNQTVLNNTEQGDIVASKEENISNPTIQNPFQIKLLDKNNDLSQETTLADKGNTDIEDVESKLDSLLNELKGKKDVNKKEENSDVKITEDVFAQKNINNGQLDKDGFDKKEGSDKKEEKIKIKDFRAKKDVDFSEKLANKEDVKIENKLEMKEVNSIRKFENFLEQDVLDQVTEKLEVSLFDNKSEMVIKLNPNDLGKVTVKISIENGVMNAKFLADSTKVKEILENNLNNLKETLKDQGLSVQDLSVSVDSGRSQNQTFEQNRVVYLNNKRDYQVDNSVSYEDTYYEFSDVNTNNSGSYWMDSTVSFLA